MLTKKQHDLLLFIHQRLQTTGVSPSFEEMKEALGLKSKSGIHRLISALEERAFLRRLPNRARALEVLRLPEGGTRRPVLVAERDADRAPSGGNVVQGQFGRRQAGSAATDVVEIPLHGRIAAGMPVEALETDNRLAVSPALIGPGEHFALEVAGDSMVDAGIFDGDYAIIRKTDQALDGQIVVALVNDADATLKTIKRRAGTVQLIPHNADHETQIYAPDQVRIQGRLVALMRRY